MMLRPNVLLLGVNALLACVFGVLMLRGSTSWEPPRPLLPELPRLKSDGEIRPAATGALTALLERPLFFDSRRPPEEDVPPQAPPPSAADPFEGVVLDGVYSAGEGAGGVSIVDREGKRRRILLGADFNGWRLASLSDREAHFERAGEQRVLVVRRAIASKPAAGAVPAPDGKRARVAGRPANEVRRSPPGPAAVDVDAVREARRAALEHRRQLLEERRRAVMAPNSASVTDAFGIGNQAAGKQ